MLIFAENHTLPLLSGLYKNVKLWVILLMTLPLSGCFEVIHEMNINHDGSGHLNIVVNFSRSKSQIEMLLLLDEINGHDIPTLEEVHQKVAVFTDSARVSKGISSVRSEFDDESFIFEFSCDFDRVNRINERLYTIWKQSEPKKAVREEYYKLENNQFEQNLSHRIIELFKNMRPADREILVGADLTSIFRFQNEIITQSNPLAIVAPNQKIIVLKARAMEMIQKPYLLNNSIKIKS